MAHNTTLPKIPLIGPTISRIGRISQIVAQPCDPDPIVMVEAFFYAAPIALGSLFKPSYLNDQEEHFQRLPQMRPGRHGRRRYRAQELFPGLGPGAQRFGWWIFKVASLAQRIGWYLLILDAGSQLAVNWTSLAYTWGGCTDPTASRVKSVLNFKGFIINQFPAYIALWKAAYFTGQCYATDIEVGNSLGEQGTVALWVSLIEPNPDYPKATFVNMRWVNDNTGEAQPPVTLRYDDPVKRTYTYVKRQLHFFEPPYSYRLEILGADGEFGLEGEMRIDCARLDGIGPDP